MHRFRTFIKNWQDVIIWIPVLLAVIVGLRYALPLLDPRAGVDGLGSLYGYATLLLKGVLITAMAWLCRRTYTRDMTDAEDRDLQSAARVDRDARWVLVIDRLEWAGWLIFWAVVLSD